MLDLLNTRLNIAKEQHEFFQHSEVRLQQLISPEKVKILIVDDTEIPLKCLEKVLRANKFIDVTAVRSGELAIKSARDNLYDIIFMDVQMPEMSGSEASAIIRGHPGKYGQVPIVGLSGYDLDDIKKQCLAAGMNHYLVKPAKASELVTLINKFVIVNHPQTAAELL